MPHEIVYPQGCRPVTEDLGPDELIRRLKTLAHTLQAMGQDEGMYQQYIPLALHLAEDHFLQHPSKDVQLLIACCIADVLRVYAPEAPYKEPEKVKTIFQFLIQQLSGLKDPKDPAFKRYFYLLENLAYVKSFNMCFELEDSQEIFCQLFSLIFKIVNDEHSSKVKSFMLDVLCPLITESDMVSNELLDIILLNIVDPDKNSKKNAYLLAKDLIIKTSDTLDPYIQSFFNHVLIFGKQEKGLQEKGLKIYSRVFELIYELNKICPSILMAVLPQLEVKLKSAQEDERLGAVSLLARMFSEKDSTLAKNYQSLWNAFLGRFNDINVSIRIKCVQYSMHFLLNHPELRQDIIDTLKMRQHDPDMVVRYEVVMAIVSTAKRDFEVVSESEDLLEFVKERTLDKKFKIRKEAMSGLAMIYRKHMSEPNPPTAARKAVTWIKDKILHGYYMVSLEDRLLVERLLNTSLVPFQLPATERMKKLYHLLGTIDGNAMKAFLELQRNQMYARKALSEWVEFHKKLDRGGVTDDKGKELEAKSLSLAKYLADQVKATEFLTKLSNDVLADTSLLNGLERIVDPNISCKECAELTGLVLKKLGAQVQTNLYYQIVKMLLERCSSVMVDYESLKILIGYVEECMRGGNLIEEIGLHPGNAGEKGLKMLMILSHVFPAHFYHADIISHLCRLVKNEDPSVLTVFTYLGKYKPVFEQFPEVSDEHGLVPLLKEYAVQGTPKQAKLAVRCLYVNYGKPAEAFFTEIIEKVRNNLTPESDNYLTAIVAFGHIAQNLPEAFPVLIKNIVSRKIVKELLVKSGEAESELPKETEWCSEEELPFETKCKVEGLKAMARWLVGLKNDMVAAKKTFRMLTAFISKKGDLLQSNKLSKAEMAWLRLAAGCAMLRICEQKGVGDQFFAEQYFTLSTLICDEVVEVRERFLAKLHKGLTRGLPFKSLPLDFMGFYALTAFEDNRRLRSVTKQNMWTQVSKRREYAKNLSVNNMCSIDKAMEDLPRILPDYMLLFSIPVLTHSEQFTDPNNHAQLTKMKHALLWVLEPLLTRNDFYCFGFYKEMITLAKNTRDACCVDDEVVNTKMWALCDLSMSLILQKTKDFDYKNMNADIKLPAMFFKKNTDPDYVNARTYIPVEFQFSESQAMNKKPPPLVSINQNRRGKNKKVPPPSSSNDLNQLATDAKTMAASDTQIKLTGMDCNSDNESDQPPVSKKLRT